MGCLRIALGPGECPTAALPLPTPSFIPSTSAFYVPACQLWLSQQVLLEGKQSKWENEWDRGKDRMKVDRWGGCWVKWKDVLQEHPGGKNEWERNLLNECVSPALRNIAALFGTCLQTWWRGRGQSYKKERGIPVWTLVHKDTTVWTITHKHKCLLVTLN